MREPASVSERAAQRGRGGEVVRFEGTDFLVVGRRLYARCPRCTSLVQVNKRLIGAMHVCNP